MNETSNDIDLTDKNELQNFLKESGLDTLIGAMRKNSPKQKNVINTKSDFVWLEQIVKSFPPIHIGLKSYYVVLVKLLDYLAKDDFSGCLSILIRNNTSLLFMWQGELIGILNNKLDEFDEEAFRYILGNYNNASIDIYRAPEGKEALPLILISIMRKDLEAKYKELDTEFTDLHKLITKLEEMKFNGYIEMKVPEGKYLACFYKGKEILTIFLNKENNYSPSALRKMRNEIGTVDVYQSKVRTLVSSMADLMNKITVLVQNRNEKAYTLGKIVEEYEGHISLKVAEEARDNVQFNITMPAGLANRDDCESFREQIIKTPEFKFVSYIFSDYFLQIAETGNVAALKFIWINITRVKVIKFNQNYHDGHVEHNFDVVMEDGSGNVLFLARHTNKVPKPYEVEVFAKQLESVKTALVEFNSLKAGFFVSSEFIGDEVISAAKKAVSRGAGVRNVLGMVGGLKVPDLLTAPKAFIKTEQNGGFYLNLIGKGRNSFEVVYPPL